MQLGELKKKGAGSAPVSKYPLIKILHEDAAFQMPVPGRVTTGRIDVVALGLIRSRSMWPREFGSGKILCQSADAETGVPESGFPWRDFKGEPAAPELQPPPSPMRDRDSQGRPTGLDCSTCNFIHFHKTRPMCGEEWIIPVVGNETRVMLLKFSRSAIPALSEYLLPFRDKRIPLYSAWTRFELEPVSRNGRIHSVPVVTQSSGMPHAGSTFKRDHRWYSAQLREARAWLQDPSPQTPAIAPLTLG